MSSLDDIFHCQRSLTLVGHQKPTFGASMLIRTPADLGAVIRDRRRQLGVDQATLAKRVGVSRQWVVGIERGRARAEVGLVLRALDTLGIRLDAATAATSETGTTPASGSRPGIDIDSIVRSARTGAKG
jgi:DNA-binding XRE family transcriptional regulator